MYEQSYHSRLDQSQQGQIRNKVPWKKIISLVATCALLTGIVFLLRIPFLQIDKIDIVGSEVEDAENVSESLRNFLAGNYLYVLPKTSIFLINTKMIKNEIKNVYPRFKTVSVNRDSIKNLKIFVEEYKGSYLWCDTNDDCAFIDENGVAFADAPYFSGSAYLKIYGNRETQYPYIPLSQKQLNSILEIDQRLKKINIEPISYLILTSNKISAIFIHNKKRTQIKFDINKDLDQTFTTLYTAMRTEPFMSMYNNEENVLEYIDLYSVNKLIYKFN